MADEVAGAAAGRDAIERGVLPQEVLVQALIDLETTEIVELRHALHVAGAGTIGVTEAHVLSGATREVTVRSGIGSTKVVEHLRVGVLATRNRVDDARSGFDAHTSGGVRPGFTLNVTS